MIPIRYTRNFFLRGICVVYLFAFLSFYIQIPGLYGDNGILPARTQLDFRTQAPLVQKFKQKPTLLWFAPYIGLNVEYMLDVLALLGVIFSFAGFVSQRFCTSPIFAILWSLYYSLYQIGQTFMMWYKWDILLLETGFLCIFIAPFWYSQRGKLSTPSDSITFWSVRWLLFRVIISNGILKLTSRCPEWWSLNALNIYFETQNIPTPLAWYAHQLPSWFLRLTTVFSFVTELAIPLLFFFPNRQVRVTAAYLQVFLQVCLIATGNYTFFNVLTICLCISLLDDSFFYRNRFKNTNNRLSKILCLLVYAGVIYGTYLCFNLRLSDKGTILSDITFTPEQFERLLSNQIPTSVYMGLASFGFTVIDAVGNSFMSNKRKLLPMFTTVFYTIATFFIFAISVVPYGTLYSNHTLMIPPQLKQMYARTQHLQLVNSYGLFHRMTGVDGRPEVIIEGSNDLEGPWKEYEFLYKPGNVNNSLPFVAPYQPRLDWQMWSAALSTYHQNPWLMSLAYRLLSAQPEVLALMNNVENPFLNKPPKYIRASLYRYHFTSTKSSKQAWWTRERIGEYFPVYSVDHPPLLDYLTKLRIVGDKPSIKDANESFKLILNTLRSSVSKLDPTIVIWSVFMAGWAIVFTGYNTPKKK